MSKRGSLTSAKSLHELKREPMIDEPSGNQDSKPDSIDSKTACDDASTSTKGIRPSKSETSIIDSFVVVENEYARRKNNANTLREGKKMSFRKKVFSFVFSKCFHRETW